MTPEAIERVRRQTAGRDALIVPVVAMGASGFNAIPDAMAKRLARELRLEVATGVVQANVVTHARASGFHRIASRARFSGVIVGGRAYFIVDDHVGMGATIAELRAHIEGGGTAIGATTLTRSRDSHQIALDDETLGELRARHGDELERLWQERFGYGLEGLTRPEAGYLLRAPTIERIRVGLAEAEAAGGA